jgi:hypothetical protein
MGTSHEHLCTFMIITRRIFLGMKNVSGNSCSKSQNTHFSESPAVYEIMWKLW